MINDWLHTASLLLDSPFIVFLLIILFGTCSFAVLVRGEREGDR